MFVMNSIMSDIAYSVGKLSRYIGNSVKYHWKALIRMLMYLKYTINYGLHYKSYPPILEWYNDAY